MSQPAPGTARALVHSSRSRTALLKRLAQISGSMTTAAVAGMEQRLPWFSQLGAKERSWITVVARAGIDGFVSWFSSDAGQDHDFGQLFNAAPRALTRRITLKQTVELVRTTIAVVEEQIQLMPRSDREILSTAIMVYSREVAFAAAEVYARVAEVRGSWDDRLEALVVDAVMRAEADDAVFSRASTLGWPARTPVSVIVGPAPRETTGSLDRIRREAESGKLSVLAAVQGDRLVLILASAKLTDDARAVTAAAHFENFFGSGPIVVGPVVDDLVQASLSARAALAGYRAAVAWPEGPSVVSAMDLLPERALSGDGHARRVLTHDVFAVLEAAGGDLLATCASFLDHGFSVEATARALYVHANTVRYRLKRIQEVTTYSPTHARDAYVLRLAITLGRLNPNR